MLGQYGDNGKEKGVGRGVMENRMETTIVYLCNMGIMEKKMETLGFKALRAF